MMKTAFKFNPAKRIRTAVLLIAIAVLPLTSTAVQATRTCPTDTCDSGGPFCDTIKCD